MPDISPALAHLARKPHRDFDVAPLSSRLLQGRLPPRLAAIVVALWVTLTGNLSLWHSLYKLAGEGEMGRQPLFFSLDGPRAGGARPHRPGVHSPAAG
jgi:hypothetical protein